MQGQQKIKAQRLNRRHAVIAIAVVGILSAVLVAFVVAPSMFVQVILAPQSVQTAWRQSVYSGQEWLGWSHKMKFAADSKETAYLWQSRARERLRGLLFPPGAAKVPLNPKVLESRSENGLTLTKLSIDSTAKHHVIIWTAVKAGSKPKGVIIAFAGHYGLAEEVVTGKGLYGYGTRVAQRGYLVIAPDLAEHNVEQRGWSLEGQRVWDALATSDYAFTTEAAKSGVGVMGHSLGGELGAYTAALDPRIKFVLTSGFLSSVPNLLDVSHCQCWNYEGLLENFSVADIYACIAPRPLILELGADEGGRNSYSIEQAHEPFREICHAYRVLGAEHNVDLHVHSGGHVYGGEGIDELMDAYMSND